MSPYLFAVFVKVLIKALGFFALDKGFHFHPKRASMG